MQHHRKTKKSKNGLVIFIFFITAALIIGTFLGLNRKKNVRQTVLVERGSITETVSLTGNTIPTKSVSLAFGNSGTISKTFSDIGREVRAGDKLAELNTNDLLAELEQAEASVDTEIAKLNGLKAGSRPEDIAASEADLEKAKQDLENYYLSIVDATTDAYTKASDAVYAQLNPLFLNQGQTSLSLSFYTSNSQNSINAQQKRASIDLALSDWKKDLDSLSPISPKENLDKILGKSISNLALVRDLLLSSQGALNGASLDAATLTTYKGYVTTGLNSVNTATKNLNTISQNISSQEITIQGAEAALQLKRAGYTVTDIDAQEAVVKRAKANVSAVKAKLEKSSIIAPFNGLITQFDAKVGEYASPATALISIIDTKFEVDAGVSETDIAKISIGDKASMVLDAFPSEIFTGTVFYIAPAETTNQGVINYKIKISFDAADPRLKSGLTANIDIATDHKDEVLVLPQYAIFQNDDGAFVEIIDGKRTKKIPITLGLQDRDGNVEITNGVSEGDEVLNIGLKTQ